MNEFNANEINIIKDKKDQCEYYLITVFYIQNKVDLKLKPYWT